MKLRFWLITGENGRYGQFLCSEGVRNLIVLLSPEGVRIQYMVHLCFFCEKYAKWTSGFVLFPSLTPNKEDQGNAEGGEVKLLICMC